MKVLSGIWNTGRRSRDSNMNRPNPKISRRGRVARHTTARAEIEFCVLAIALALLPLNGRDQSIPRTLARTDAASFVIACSRLNCAEKEPSLTRDQQRASRGVASTWLRAEHFRAEFSATRSADNMSAHKLTPFGGQKRLGFVFSRNVGAEFPPQREMHPVPITRAAISDDRGVPDPSSSESFGAVAISDHSDTRTSRINGFNR